MKYLLVVLVVGLVLWLMFGRGRTGGSPPGGSAGKAQKSGKAGKTGSAVIVACAHCGLHLPQPEALCDAGGRPYCSAEHRLAGPR